MTDKQEKGLVDAIGKAVSVGIGAAFMTEEYVKSVLGDVPKETLSGVLQSAKAAKRDFVSTVKEEAKRHLSKVDPVKALLEVVENYDIEIKFKKKKKKKTAREN